MSADFLRLTHGVLEHRLRVHLPAFQSFEQSGATPLEQLGMDARSVGRLLQTVESMLGIAVLRADLPPGVLQTPNTLLAFLSAAALEHALGAPGQGTGCTSA